MNRRAEPSARPETIVSEAPRGLKPAARWVLVCNLACLGGLCAAMAGCDAAQNVAGAIADGGAAGTDEVAVELVNTSDDYDVEATLYFHDDDDVLLEDILTNVGRWRGYRIEPGQTVTFSESCDDLRAIIIDDADLRVVGDIGPDTDTDILREGDDFRCNDTLTFTFSHTDVLVDFHVTDTVR